MRIPPQIRHGIASRFGGAAHGKAAFTLLEMLLAMALMAMLVTLTGRIAVGSLTSRRVAQEKIDRMQREADLFDRIADDLGDLLRDLPGDESALTVFGIPRQVLQISVLTAVESSGEALHLIRRPSTVRYRLVRRPGEESLRLIREVIDRTSLDATPVRETIAPGVGVFSVEVLVDGRWLRTHPTHDHLRADPAALRVRCQWDDPPQTAGRTFVLSTGA